MEKAFEIVIPKLSFLEQFKLSQINWDFRQFISEISAFELKLIQRNIAKNKFL